MTAITFTLTCDEQREGLLSGQLHLFQVFITTTIEDDERLIWLDDVYFTGTPQASDLKDIFDADALRDIEEELEHENPDIDKSTFWEAWNNALLNPEECVCFRLVPTEYLLDRPKPPGADLMNELYAEVEV